jgi:peptidoglycan-associated lipoprotein
MRKTNLTGFLIVLMIFVLTTACSKKLMPPEIEASGAVSESGFEDTAAMDEVPFGVEEDSAFDSDQGYAGDSGIPEEGAYPGDTAMIVSEEDISALDSPTGSTGDLGSVPGNGSAGAFGMDGSADNGGLGGTGLTSPDSSGFGSVRPDGEVDEARLFTYRGTAELKDIHFEFDQYDLDERSKTVLRENADFLQHHPEVRIEIQGHCDERGTNNYNLALGQRRANSTKRFLASLGVPDSRMHVISYGEEKPFCAESNENCWWRNRRAHFMVAR